MIVHRAICLTLLLLTLPASADRGGRHLSHEELFSLAPSPDIRPTYGPNGQYVSGGIGILVYDGINVLDAIGPYQVFSAAALRPMLISASRNPDGTYKTRVTASSGLELIADRTIANTPALEVLVVPGGTVETVLLAKDPGVIAWIKATHTKTLWTASVCTGSWVLGAAGVLKGKRATTNWHRADELLAHFGAIPRTRQRYVFDGRVITAAGVTAGIDMALALVQVVFRDDLNHGRDYTQAVMLDLEYDPAPPIEGGSPQKTDPYVYQGMFKLYDYFGLADLVKEIPSP